MGKKSKSISTACHNLDRHSRNNTQFEIQFRKPDPFLFRNRVFERHPAAASLDQTKLKARKVSDELSKHGIPLKETDFIVLCLNGLTYSLDD